MLKVLYLSTLCSVEEFAYLFNNANVKLSQQMQKYNLVLAQGFAKREGITITAISARPVTNSTHKKRIFRKKEEIENGIKYLYLPFLNIKVVRSINILLNSMIAIKRIFRNNNQEKLAILCDTLNIPLTLSSLTIGRLLGIPVVGIVTDVPGYYASDEGEISLKRKLFINYHQNVIRKCTCYVFLSKYMNDVINKDKKPFCIIEGQVDSEMVNVSAQPYKEKDLTIVMYAGSINRENGVDILVKAFIKEDINNAELHIYGFGSYSEELRQIERKSSKIKYFGAVSNNVIVNKEIEADLLVNPRPTNREFVKYSFPSKNMEYMVSGTPVLTTRIPGMPEEYNNHIYFINDESVEGLSKALREVLAISKQELYNKGKIAKEFVLKEKNNKVQATKIINMLEYVINRRLKGDV